MTRDRVAESPRFHDSKRTFQYYKYEILIFPGKFGGLLL
jgi:hypothetical protein